MDSKLFILLLVLGESLGGMGAAIDSQYIICTSLWNNCEKCADSKCIFAIIMKEYDNRTYCWKYGNNYPMRSITEDAITNSSRCPPKSTTSTMMERFEADNLEEKKPEKQSTTTTFKPDISTTVNTTSADNETTVETKSTESGDWILYLVLIVVGILLLLFCGLCYKRLRKMEVFSPPSNEEVEMGKSVSTYKQSQED